MGVEARGWRGGDCHLLAPEVGRREQEMPEPIVPPPLPPHAGDAVDSAGAAPNADIVGVLERQFDSLQHEMDALRGEVNLLRRRDDTLTYYMQRLDEELRLAARL